MAQNTLTIVPETPESVGLAPTRSSGAIKTTLATFALALGIATSAQAQQSPNTQVAAHSASSASAPAAKGVEAGQILNGAEKWEKMTPDEVKKLSRAEKEIYYAWKEAQLDATIILKKGEGQKLDQTVIKQYQGYIKAFIELNQLRGKPGFDESVYKVSKTRLQSVLKNGDPVEVVRMIRENGDLLNMLNA